MESIDASNICFQILIFKDDLLTEKCYKIIKIILVIFFIKITVYLVKMFTCIIIISDKVV